MDKQISKDIRDKAHFLCASILKGKWALAQPESLTITYLPHGLTNDLYICALPDGDACPNQVVLRLYGKATSDISSQIEIVKLLADKNLGPCLYGCFEEGRLEEYLPSSPLTYRQMRDPCISAVIARKIALVQNIQSPVIDDNENWIVDNCREFLRNFVHISSDKIEHLIVEAPSETKDVARELVANNFDNEIEFINNLIKLSNSPRVFSNNDLHQNNILLVEKSEDKMDLFDRVVLIDFEYSCNNYRSYEIANHLAEWRYDYHHKDYPYFIASEDMFPTEEQQRHFIRAYLKESKTNRNKFGTKLQNSINDEIQVDEKEVDAFLEEMQPFIMAADLFWSLWAISCAIDKPTKPSYWHIASTKWLFYNSYKDKFLKEKSLINGKSKL